MITNTFRGRSFLNELDYTREEIETLLDVAADLKRKFTTGESHKLLDAKTLFMIFYNQSLRTRNSFEAGMTQLGGHAHFLDPGKIYAPAMEGFEVAYETERVSDVARTLGRMGHGIAIRMYGDPVNWHYGMAHELLREFERYAGLPIINMECDKYHPCQGLADALTLKEKYNGNLKGKKFVMSWAYSPSVHKPLSVPQSVVHYMTMMGMDVVLAHPKGLELDKDVISACEEHASKYGGAFEISNDMEEAFKGADVVYPKAWTSIHTMKPYVEESNIDKSKEVFEANKDWICDEKKLKLCKDDVLYMHCLPCDRGYEVTNEVVDGPHSIVFDEAENRLHAQKAVMALTMK